MSTIQDNVIERLAKRLQKELDIEQGKDAYDQFEVPVKFAVENWMETASLMQLRNLKYIWGQSIQSAPTAESLARQLAGRSVESECFWGPLIQHYGVALRNDKGFCSLFKQTLQHVLDELTERGIL